ncbi:hypothetical protein PR202_gb19701 [Eleusine coracana subsp. coracana]|uniref:VQ domain-containing protein n=1 Tax=Eleusine coracana subsp. coracana TaxID=191504 RepID=A0AAV5F8X5_ELECO|nr:hypothetical protein QOZ80_3BG0281840 [Eleusine coracana subsp. coracana]GJN31316.1 hypothetical protein PR202_gb19701 [Eleusine coracana subsp. coracana]
MDAAVSCVGVAPQQSQTAILSRSFTDAAAIARALSFSLSDNAPDLPPAPSPAFVHGAAGAGNHPSPPSSSARSPGRRLGPAAGGTGKRRRPRPSKRLPTTYISTDAATFRVMVQRVTGADDDQAAGPWRDVSDHLGLGFLLPHLGVVGPSFLSPDHDAAAAYASLAPVAATQAAAAAAAEQPLFPTLDSWNVMYGKNEVA